ncbi:MAG: serine hydrolase [Polyangiaceae bacterium]
MAQSTPSARASAAVPPTASKPESDPPADASADSAASAPDPYRPVDPAALGALEEEARTTGSSALVVRQDGKLLRSSWFGSGRAPIQSMSITKSVLALVVGCLLKEGKLSVETPVAQFFPAWNGSPKAKITVSHLLSHSSGLEEGDSTSEIYRSKSFVDHALSSKLQFEPGTHYEYGNRAANLLAGVIARAAGKTTEQASKECLFEPLGIQRFVWSVDARGQAHGLAGLFLLPDDLAKIGELVLGRGVYEGRRVLPEDWVLKVTESPAPQEPPHKPMAWLWWRLSERTTRVVDDTILDAWRRAKVPEEVTAKVQPLSGRAFTSNLEFVGALREAFGDASLKVLSEEVYAKKLPDAHYSFGRFLGSYAHGSLGQFLVVVPEQKLVAVRMRRPPRSAVERKSVEKSFPDFPDRVIALTQLRQEATTFSK